MCVIKRPKIVVPTQGQAQEKPLPVLTNPLLDGIDPSANALRIGRTNLRIDLTRRPQGARRLDAAAAFREGSALAPSSLRIGTDNGLRG